MDYLPFELALKAVSFTQEHIYESFPMILARICKKYNVVEVDQFIEAIRKESGQ